MGGVKIQSVQVKRLGHFYHLPDSMLVSSAFGGSKKAWFVFVEASCLGERDKEQALPGATLEKDLRVSALAACSGDDDCRDNNKTADFSHIDELPSVLEKRKSECIENDGFTMNKKNKIENKTDSLIEASGKVQSDIEMRKIRDELCDDLSSDTNLMLPSGAQKTLESETTADQTGELEKELYRDRSNSTTGEHVTKLAKVPPPQEVKGDELVTGLGNKKDKKQKKILSVSSEQLAISQPNSVIIGSVSSANLHTESPEANKDEAHVELLPNDDPKVMLSKRCIPLDEGGADGTNNESIPSPDFMGTSSPTEAVGSVRTKKKKTKAKKKAPGSTELGTKITAPLSSTVADLALKDLKNDKIVNDQSMLSVDESQKFDTSEKEIVSLHNPDPQVQPSESFEPSDQIETQEMSKGSILSSNLSLANEAVETGSSHIIKRKKLKPKKSADNLHESYLPGQGVLDVEMNDGTSERNKTIPQIDKLKDNSELSHKYKPEVLPEGNKILDSAKETLNGKESGIIETSLEDKHEMEAGKSGRSHKKKRAKVYTAIDGDITSMEHSNPVNASPAKHFEGDRGLSLKNEAEVTSSKASKPLDLGGVTVNCSEPGFAGQKSDNENGLEAVKPGGSQKKKKAKRNTDSVSDAPVKHFASEAQENQRTFAGTVEKPKKGARDSSISCASTDNESSGSKRIVSPLPDTDQTRETAIDLHGNLREAKNVENMDTSALQNPPTRLKINKVQQLLPGDADKEQVNEKNIKKKVKKTKRIQKNVAETQNSSKIEGKNVSDEELAGSGDKMGERDPQFDTMDRSASAETRTGNNSTLAEVLLGKHTGVASKSSNPEEDLKGACSSEVPCYHSRDNNLEGRPESMLNTKNIAETSKGGDEINFRHYFTPEQQRNKASSAKVKEALHSTKAKRKTKKRNFISDETLKASQLRHNEHNTDGDQLEESSTDAKGNKDLASTNKEKLEAYGDAVKASKSHDADEEKTPQKSIKLVVGNGSGSSKNNPSWLEDNKGTVMASNSSCSAKGSKRAFQDTSNKKQQSGFNKGRISAQKKLSKNDADIVNSSQQKKSLLSAPGAIFSDDSSGSSGDENHGNSESSTRMPSDHSSSSGFSDGESELSQDSRGNGYGGRKSFLNSKYPDPKDMSLHMILKSSKRFKKAKLTAAQSQEADTESQPVEFVPDSQANQ